MSFPVPSPQYDADNEAAFRDAVRQALETVFNGTIIVGKGTVLKIQSPNGTIYRFTVTNAGALVMVTP